MISGYIRGQTLTLAQTVIAADSVNYLTAKFTFQTADWNGLLKIAHFSNGTNAADVELTGDEILSEDGLNLTEGTWQVSVTGHEYSGGELTKRITTTIAELTVKPSGVPDGEPLPNVASYGEQILSEVQSIHSEVDEQLAAQDRAVTEQLEAQDAAVDHRLDENEAAVAAMLGKVKNERDGSFIKLWAGSEAQYAATAKASDTIYLVDLLEGGEPV